MDASLAKGLRMSESLLEHAAVVAVSEAQGKDAALADKAPEAGCSQEAVGASVNEKQVEEVHGGALVIASEEMKQVAGSPAGSKEDNDNDAAPSPKKQRTSDVVEAMEVAESRVVNCADATQQPCVDNDVDVGCIAENTSALSEATKGNDAVVNEDVATSPIADVDDEANTEVAFAKITSLQHNV